VLKFAWGMRGNFRAAGRLYEKLYVICVGYGRAVGDRFVARC
jgi:hypothetical protein